VADVLMLHKVDMVMESCWLTTCCTAGEGKAHFEAGLLIAMGRGVGLDCSGHFNAAQG
jgi:hypothetical protein